MVVLKDIMESKRDYSTINLSQISQISLQEYLTLAERCIIFFCDASTANTMLSDEDAVSFVATFLMESAGKWREDGGRTFKSYLNDRSSYAIRIWLQAIKRSQKHMHTSLDYEFSDGNSRCVKISDITHDGSTTPIETLVQNEKKSVISDAIQQLPERQRMCIELVFMQSMTQAEASRELQVSREAVGQLKKKAVRNLKRILTEHGQTTELYC